MRKTPYHPVIGRSLAGLALSSLLLATVVSGASAQSGSPGVVAPGAPTPAGTPVPIGKIGHPTGATDVVLRMESGGGMIRYGYFSQAPVFTLYGDNTVIFRPSTPSDGSALTPFQQAVMSPEQVDALLAYALGPGYLTDARTQYSDMMVSDAPTTVFTVNANGLNRSISVYALGMGDTTGPDAQAYAAMSSLGQLLATFEEQVAKGQVQSVQVYQPSGYRAYLTESGPGQPDVMAWPWDDLIPADFTADPNDPSVRVAELTPDQVAKLTAVPSGGFYSIPLQAADGTFYNLALRPLLPGDTLLPADFPPQPA
jgi:hypothetical protein